MDALTWFFWHGLCGPAVNVTAPGFYVVAALLIAEGYLLGRHAERRRKVAPPPDGRPASAGMEAE